MNKQFYILDVFAESKYAGNQLAVVLDFERQLTGEQMQMITREMNYSETTFILSEAPSEDGYDVRIFTPAMEMPFAGHPTIGTAYIIQEIIEQWKHDTITLNLKAGQVPVTRTVNAHGEAVLWLSALQPDFGEHFMHVAFAPILNLEPDDFDKHFPLQTVSTGLPFNLVPVKKLEAVKRAKMNLPVFEQFLAAHAGAAKGIFLFCPEAEEAGNHIHSRMFGDHYGVAEDPATGSANACLAAYMAKYKYLGVSTVDARVEQGYEINRKSLINLKASVENDHYNIRVGGKCIITAEGKLV